MVYECIWYTIVYGIRVYMVYECIWYTSVYGLRVYMVYECIWYTSVYGIRVYMVYECIWYTSVYSIRVWCIWDGILIYEYGVYGTFYTRILIYEYRTGGILSGLLIKKQAISLVEGLFSFVTLFLYSLICPSDFRKVGQCKSSGWKYPCIMSPLYSPISPYIPLYPPISPYITLYPPISPYITLYPCISPYTTLSEVSEYSFLLNH